MIKRTIILSFSLFVFSQLSLLALDLDIDFHKKYRESMAERLINNKREYTEAVKFIDKVLPEVEDEPSRQLLTAQKIVAIGLQKGRDKEALEQVSTLKNQPLQGYCRYMIYSRQNQLDVIADKYLDENISLWPKELQTIGYITRGKIYQFKLDKKQLAIADYKKALEIKQVGARVGGRTRVDLYIQMAKMTEDFDPEAAKQYFSDAHVYFEAYMTRHLTSNAYNDLIWEWAQLLEKLREGRELLEVLNKFNGKNPDQIKKVLAAKADAYGRLGDTAKQKLYQSYLENFIKNLDKKGSL
ncbi:MAG: hypothetical protein LC725_04135 [Lentisphaerae bacterium]|nr:hypothetical protein [Lentisphaerota bacterium]